MLPLGTEVHHKFNDHLTGTVCGYGTIVNPFTGGTHGVYLVNSDNPVPIDLGPGRGHVGVTIAVWQADRTEKMEHE